MSHNAKGKKIMKGRKKIWQKIYLANGPEDFHHFQDESLMCQKREQTKYLLKLIQSFRNYF